MKAARKLDLDRASKTHDSPVAVLYASRIAIRLVPLAARAGLSPTQASALSFLASVAAAGCIVGVKGHAGAAVAAILIQAGFILDCLDGQLARATGQTSDLGAYVDAMSDLAKVFFLLAAAGWMAGTEGLALAGWAFFFFALCQHHVHVTKTFPQRDQLEYEASAAPWKRHLAVRGQRIDVAFAIGEVLLLLSIGAWTRWYAATLWVLALVLPVQFASYAIRFWRLRYRSHA